MTTRKDIIAHIDSELSRLERARDFLAAAFADPRAVSAIASISRVKTAKTEKTVKPRAKKKAVRKPRTASVAAAVAVEVAPPPPPAIEPVKEEPLVQRVPPKRRMERRHSQSEKALKSSAALTGMVPTGPVAVSATEARKIQERAVPAAPVVPEVRPEATGERTLGSLIQAFERRSGLSGLETP
jgi:hypothetical protein